MFVLDLDGTVVNVIEALRLRLEGEGFTTYPNVTGYSSFAGIVAESDALNAAPLLEQYIREQSTFAMSQPMLGAKEMVLWLQSRELFKGFVTRRPRAYQKMTQTWLEEHGFPVEPIKFVTLPSKAVDVLTLGGRALIEDNPTEIEAVMTELPVLVFDQPYNKHVEGGIRLHNWYALERLLKALPIDVRKQKPWR